MINIYILDAADAGGCNGCGKLIDEIENGKVYSITFSPDNHSTTIRLCFDCEKELRVNAIWAGMQWGSEQHEY